MSEHVRLETEGRLGWLVLDRPDRKNAVDEAMWRAITVLVDRAESDDRISVLIVRSSSPDVFSAGADLSEYRTHLDDVGWRERSLDVIAGALDAIRRMSKPTIAAIGGVCMGGGAGIVLACDLRVADERARFAIPPARLGLVYPFADTRDLVWLVGPSEAKRLLFSAETFDANEAARIGFVDEVVPSDLLIERVEVLAGEIAANSQTSIRAMKRIVAEIQSGTLEETEEIRGLIAETITGPDHAEGVRAFVERRSPRFDRDV